ncbi:MAG: caspase family protein, partial [Gemmataceae bacterium]|nr:caspase family protein [Gemmataceae bacterium]
PRRMLFVHISHYMYLNPLTYSERTGFDRTRAAADRLAYEWHVPNDAKGTNGQLFYLSDTARNNPVLPLKPVVVGAFEKFFETSRAQDRIIVYFGGHAAEKDGKAYLVPAEGDLEDVATLIPVADIYAKLGECPATQKVVIWDVCRFNPERGRSRPGSEPMTEKLAEALSAAPPGVQVVLTCQPGENALEFFTLLPDGGAKRSENVSGSSFLEAVRYVGEKNKLPSKDASPAEPFPVEDWVKAVDDRLNRVSTVASGQFVGEKLKQSVKLAGSMPEAQTAYNSAEAPAARFEFPKADSGATASEVAEIFDELQLPQIDAEGGKDGARDDVRADALIPFRADQLADFKDDVPRAEVTKPENREKYLFRVTVIEAFAMINDLWGGGNGGPRIEREFKPAAGSTMATEAVKKEIEKYQDFPATAGTKLESMLTRLEAVEGMRAAQPKRWQAHYDYAVAQVKARLAFLDEYNARLGNVRTDVLPELDPKKGQDGYRLVSSETIKSKKAKEYADDAKERFDKIIADYKGTPWAIQARRDKTFAMGLVWQPFSSGAGMPDPK